MANIAYVGLSGDPSGGTRILVEHLNRLSKSGHTCELILLVPRFVDWLPVSFRQTVFQQQPLTRHYDVVVATEVNTWPIVAEFKNFPFADRRKVFVQMAEHRFFSVGSDQWKELQPHKELLGFELSPVTISRWLANWILRECGFIAPIVPNGVNFDIFHPDPFEEDPPREGIRILVEGHARNMAKDVEQMSIRAVRGLRSLGHDIEVWGFSQYPPMFDDYDRYWRRPTQATIRKIYSSCDIILKATRFEGRSCVDVEAMACGCAVNRAIRLGTDDLLNEWNCLVVQYANMTQFVGNAIRLIEDEKLRKFLIKNGLEYVRDKLDWDKIVPSLEQALLTP